MILKQFDLELKGYLVISSNHEALILIFVMFLSFFNKFFLGIVSGINFFFFTAPAKPNKPTVTGTAIDTVNVIYNFGIGGGYTHDFRVMYRKKCKLP